MSLANLLLEKYGPLMGGAELRRALGFRTPSAFAYAQRAGQLGIRVFDIPGRRGKFALTADVAAWLGRLRGDDPDQKEEDSQ